MGRTRGGPAAPKVEGGTGISAMTLLQKKLGSFSQTIWELQIYMITKWVVLESVQKDPWNCGNLSRRALDNDSFRRRNYLDKDYENEEIFARKKKQASLLTCIPYIYSIYISYIYTYIYYIGDPHGNKDFTDLQLNYDLYWLISLPGFKVSIVLQVQRGSALTEIPLVSTQTLGLRKGHFHCCKLSVCSF